MESDQQEIFEKKHLSMNNNNLDTFVHLLKRWGQERNPAVFRHSLKTLPDIATALQVPDAETTPSYEVIAYATEPETTAVADRPLNTTHRVVVGRKEWRLRQKTPKERALEHWEDDMAEIDILRGRLRTAAAKAESWLYLSPDEKKDPQKLAGLFSAVDKATVERVHGFDNVNGEFGERILDAVLVYPEKLLPLISKRLKRKDQELNNCILKRSRIGPDGLVYFVHQST